MMKPIVLQTLRELVGLVTVMYFICNPKIAADHANRHYQGAYTESEGQNLEHRVDECVIPMAIRQRSVHQQYHVEEEHKNPLMVHNAHANYHPGAVQFEAVPVQQ